MSYTIFIEYKGVELEIDYDYQPYEAQKTNCRNDDLHEGCPEQIESINEIKHKGVCFVEVFEDYMEEIADTILDKMHDI